MTQLIYANEKEVETQIKSLPQIEETIYNACEKETENDSEYWEGDI